MEKVTVYARSNNDHLFGMMANFIPQGVEVVQVTGFDQWQQASDYLYHIIDNAATDWIINIDIDCFVFNWPAVMDMVEFMAANKKIYSGMPDGGAHPGRSHAWTTMNPFFNILNASEIRKVKEQCGFTWQQIEKHGYLPQWDEKKPSWLLGTSNSANGEPFHGLFNWLYSYCVPIMHTAKVLGDGLTTYLADHLGNEFCVHAWMSRHYNTEESTKYRIDFLYEQAKELKNEV